MNLLQLLKSTKTKIGSGALREALAAAEAEATAATTRIDRLAGDRAEALLDGNEALLTKLGRELADVRTQADRAELAVVGLQARLEAAEAAERQAETAAIRDGAVGAQERGRELLDSYADSARALVAIVAELHGLEQAIATANVRLGARDASQVDGIEHEFWRGRETVQQFPAWSIIDNLRLPHPDEPRTFLWPEARP